MAVAWGSAAGKDMVDGLRLKEADSLEVQQYDTDLLRRTMEALGK